MIRYIHKVASPWRKGLAGCQGVNASDYFMDIQTFLRVDFDHARNKIKYIIAVGVFMRNLKCPCKDVNLAFILKTVFQEKKPVQTASERPNVDPVVMRDES